MLKLNEDVIPMQRHVHFANEIINNQPRSYLELFQLAKKKYENKSIRKGYQRTLLSYFRHSSHIKKEAKQLFILLKNTPNRLLQKQFIIAYLKTRTINTHSFASYLIDLLKEEYPFDHWEQYDPKKVIFFQGLLYHGTTVTPEIIFKQGLQPANKSHKIEYYSSTTSGSIGVSTSKDKKIAYYYALPHPRLNNNYTNERPWEPFGYIYKINYRGYEGIDIDETQSARLGKTFHLIQEVNVVHTIDPYDIVGAWKIHRDKSPEEWISNPSYDVKNNTHNQKIKLKFPHSYYFYKQIYFKEHTIFYSNVSNDSPLNKNLSGTFHPCCNQISLSPQEFKSWWKKINNPFPLYSNRLNKINKLIHQKDFSLSSPQLHTLFNAASYWINTGLDDSSQEKIVTSLRKKTLILLNKKSYESKQDLKNKHDLAFKLMQLFIHLNLAHSPSLYSEHLRKLLIINQKSNNSSIDKLIKSQSIAGDYYHNTSHNITRKFNRWFFSTFCKDNRRNEEAAWFEKLVYYLRRTNTLPDANNCSPHIDDFIFCMKKELSSFPSIDNNLVNSIGLKTEDIALTETKEKTDASLKLYHEIDGRKQRMFI